MRKLLILVVLSSFSDILIAQISPGLLPTDNIKRCFTMEAIREAIKKNPGIEERWKKEGEKRFQSFLQRSASARGQAGGEIVIPVVFHLIDNAQRLAWITDRNLYDQLEILNDAFSGGKVEKYKNVIPQEIFARHGEIPVKFVMARRTPSGQLTSGIERRTNTTPDRVKIKSTADGGLDPWDTDRYLNIWAGSFTGDDGDLLGISTFPYVTTEGPQGVVVNIASLPFTSNVQRDYFSIYAEGATVVHEVGHYFYLYHTFGDMLSCNNTDFRTEPGWPLPANASQAGDDTPAQNGENSSIFGNPTMNYSDGCTTESFGEMYGSFMNYFDDRALFMFSQGHGRRILACIDAYRPDLANSPGAVAPGTVNDAYLISLTPYGSPERKTHILNKTALTATIRNYGTVMLNDVHVSVLIDGITTFSQIVTVNLNPGEDKEINLGDLNTSAGDKIITVFTSSPNDVQDQFTQNDTLESFVNVISDIEQAPYSQEFNDPTFPPAGWQVWNPNTANDTWARNETSGFPGAGSATLQFYNFSGHGQLDELIMPALDMATADSAELNFNYAYATANHTNVNTWDGLEIYISNDSGRNYQLIFKKSGNFLQTVSQAMTSPFKPLPSDPGFWKNEKINLQPYLNGNPLLLKFRGINAQGNNLYLDDISVNLFNAFDRDADLRVIKDLPEYVCGEMSSPSVSFRNNGKDTLRSLTINYQINDGTVSHKEWTGKLAPNTSADFPLGQLPGLSTGNYELTVFSTLPNRLNDEFTQNDTIRSLFYVMGHATLPESESFESASFPPDQWIIQPNGNGHTWEISNSSSDDNASAVLRNFNYDMHGRADNLISPIIAGTGSYDSIFVSLDYAYLPGIDMSRPDGLMADTMEVLLSLDCGKTFITLFKEWGTNLSSVSNAGDRTGQAFTPMKEDWKDLRFYLTPFVGSSDFQIFISSKGNNRNNLYVDNIKILGISVPSLLKEQGYLLYPSPFADQFLIRNFEQPTGLRSVNIYNSSGQLIWQRNFNGNAEKIITINAAGWARGIYTVRLLFDDRAITDRVVKQ